MNRIWLIIGLGGFLGSVARYFTALQFTKWFPSAFPWGTFVVNIVGCLLIGLIYGFAERYQWSTPALRLFLATGFCGGFTTFSSFAFENVQLIQTGSFGVLAAYTVASVVLGLAFATLGSFIATLQ